MDIVTLAAARKGGGSGGDVTKQYVDEHLALKADKTETSEYPIADTTSGVNLSITDSADGLIQDVKVYGESRTSKNLLNPTEITHGYGVSAGTGELYQNSNCMATNYIDVHSFSNFITHTYSDAQGYVWGAFYNSSLQHIGYFSQQSPNNVIPVPSNAYYVRVSLLEVDIDTAMIESGSEPTPYEPYFSGIHGIGEDGELEITTANSDNTASSTATVTTGIPLYSDGDIKDELDEKKGVVAKRCGKKSLDDLEWTLASLNRWASYISDIKPIAANTDIVNVISDYTAVSANALIADETLNGIALNTGGNILVRNGSTTNAPTGDIVYELAEPYELPLTSTELSALRNLRTYNPTTNVTVTDSPTVDIGYLLDTDNGQAVANVQTDLQGQINTSPAWLTSIPENHKCIYRGKYLGTSVTTDQLAAIADGSFDDLYVGDYWEIPVTIDGTTVSNKWRIADFDYFLHNGTDKHHAVIVPDNTLYTAQMGGTISNGYYQSAMFTTNLNKGRTAIANAFPNMVISYEFYDIIGQTTTKYDCTSELMALSSLTGVYSDYIHTNYLPVLPQMSLFRIMPDFIGANPNGSGHDAGFLTQTVKTSSFYWAISTTVSMMEMRTSDSYGVRPFFLLGDTGT